MPQDVTQLPQDVTQLPQDVTKGTKGTKGTPQPPRPGARAPPGGNGVIIGKPPSHSQGDRSQGNVHVKGLVSQEHKCSILKGFLSELWPSFCHWRHQCMPRIYSWRP